MKKLLLLTATALLVSNAFAQAAPSFGSFERPFAANSLWNSRPLNPVLGTDKIPAADDPKIQQGEYSTKAFKADESDPPMTIYAAPGSSGVYDPERRGYFPTMTIPRWPEGVVPASGGDGHADIVDVVSGKIHSFWRLQFINGRWTAGQHAWSRLDGRGWPDASHGFQGARAVGVPSIAGVIRLHEFDDGEDHFKHALAMSVEKQGLSGNPQYSANPAFVYPATAADAGSNTSHTGGIPQGALMMLPANYQMKISNPRLQKVVNTLKLFGARVIDDNGDTPFFIYVENDDDTSNPTWALSTGNWEEVRRELGRIREELRQVISSSGYVDGNGQPTDADKVGNQNILSMRGPWEKASSTTSNAVQFNSDTGTIEFPARPANTWQRNGVGTGIASTGLGPITWATPRAGEKFLLTAIGTGNTKISFSFFVGDGNPAYHQTGWLTNGQTAVVTWLQGASMSIDAWSGTNQAGSIRATMVRAPVQ